MYHPETAYTFAKERQVELERAAETPSRVLAIVARLIGRDDERRRA